MTRTSERICGLAAFRFCVSETTLFQSSYRLSQKAFLLLRGERFYSNNTLLRPGVTDYSVNLGVERENVGRANANYGSALGVLNYRRGITNTLTLGSRGEFSKDTNNIGVSANYTLGNMGTLTASSAL